MKREVQTSSHADVRVGKGYASQRAWCHEDVTQNLNRRQAQWALYLSRFNFTLKHVPGSKMGKADGLSQKSNWEKGGEGDNEQKVLLKPKWLEVKRI